MLKGKSPVHSGECGLTSGQGIEEGQSGETEGKGLSLPERVRGGGGDWPLILLFLHCRVTDPQHMQRTVGNRGGI